MCLTLLSVLWLEVKIFCCHLTPSIFLPVYVYLTLLGLVRNVARYTMASPMFFTEMDDYFDGGMFCNNPTEHGYTAIQKSWSDIKIAMVVSIGSGQSPTTKMRMADTPEALFFGKHWVRPGKQSKRAQEFSSSLSNAVSSHTLCILFPLRFVVQWIQTCWKM